MPSLTEKLRELRAQVEKHLDQALKPRPGLPESLRQAMRYSLLAPGKRLRPLLVVLAAEACAGMQTGRTGSVHPWPSACAVEMVHTYSLIHDDLPAMDNDDLRRGMPTCHKKFGEALAILAGDALLTQAFEVLVEGYPAPTAAACCRELARAAGAAGMVGGQVDDLAWSAGVRGQESGVKEEAARSFLTPDPSAMATIEGLEQLHARKTGALIQASLQLGVLSAHAEGGAPAREIVERFDTFGRCLGLLFQITDDLLDVEGNAELTGKRVQKDAARGKLTYPGFLGIADSRRRAQRLSQQAKDALVPLGIAAGRLLELVEFVLERDR